MLFTRPLVTVFAEHYAAVPGKIELAIALARLTFPFLTLVAIAAACMGMLNSLRRFFMPALSPAMFNVAAILVIPALVPVFRAAGVEPIFAAGVGDARGRRRPGRAAVAGAPARRVPLPPDPRAARPGPARDPRPDGPGNDRPRRGPDQRADQHAAGHEPGRWRDLVARLRLPADVHADRALRPVDRDRRPADAVAPCRARRPHRDAPRRCRAACG